MFNRFIIFIKKKRNNKFVLMMSRTLIGRRFIKMLVPRFSKVFFTQNAERVCTVANMLADEKSRNTYLGMVKFRQTRKKRDFPILAVESSPQYFIDKLKLNNKEIFVDCGAYDGDTIDDFLKHCPDYKHIIALEPSPVTFEKLKEKHGTNPKITLLNSGVSDKEGEVLFSTAHHHATAHSVIKMANLTGINNLSTIKVRTIDNLDLEYISFIKMDIEGSEYDALIGAKKTILRDRPKLAICIYHTNEDMIRIAEYIHGLVPEYKLYVRQHDIYPNIDETVLYAL